MPLSPQSWLPKAEGLAPGRSIRADHDCGGGRTLLIRNEGGKLSAYCFRCNEPGRSPAPVVSLAERIATASRLAAADQSLSACAVELPGTARLHWADWPAAAKLWFLKAGLSEADSIRLSAYYHQASERVVLPVTGDKGTPVFWQARSIDGRQPKYMAPSVDKAEVLPRWGSAPSCPRIPARKGFSLQGARAKQRQADKGQDR